MSVNATPSPEPEAIRNGISNFLSANGFVETMNNSLTKGAYYKGLTTYPEEKCVNIVNPLSSDLNVMRQTLIFNGLEVIAYNANRQIPSMRIYEYGSVYSRDPQGDGKTLASYEEHPAFALFISGTPDKSWNSQPGKSSFFTLKGYVDLLLRRFGADLYQMEATPAPADIFSEGIAYSLPGQHIPLAVIGTVLPSLARKFDVKQPVFAAEINWNTLFMLVKRDKVAFRELPKFPEVRRDLALLLDESVSYSDLYRSSFKAAKKLLKNVTLFDVYRGDKIPAGKKQYALGFVLQDQDRTLTDADVEKIMSKLLSTFTNEYGAALR
jgi:phenylalanyl-tRNA synthetase beta chain